MLIGGVSLYLDEEEGIESTCFNKERLYNYVTGEELTKLTDVFVEDSLYMDIIKGRIVKALNEGEYSVYDVLETLEKAEYELEGESVVVTVPTIPDFEINVYFNYFDKSMFKLFKN